MTDGRRLVAAFIGLLVALSGLAQPAIGGIHLARSSVAAYDGHDDLSTLPMVMNEQGLPDIVGRDTTHDIDVRGLRGSSACPRVVLTEVCDNTYNKVAQSAHLANGGRSTQEQVRQSGRDLPPLPSAGVAAKTAPQVLKGPIADAVPKTLPQQLALGAAKEGRGTRIMANLADDPRLVANYGPGEWVKMQYVMRGNDTSVTVHYFRNLTTKLDVEFKFK